MSAPSSVGTGPAYWRPPGGGNEPYAVLVSHGCDDGRRFYLRLMSTPDGERYRFPLVAAVTAGAADRRTGPPDGPSSTPSDTEQLRPSVLEADD